MGQVQARRVVMVGPERAVLASLFGLRREHEVIHEELVAPCEQLGERFRAVRPLENVALLDTLPGERPPQQAQLVPGSGELLLSGEQRRAGRDPLVVGDYGVVAQVVECHAGASAGDGV